MKQFCQVHAVLATHVEGFNFSSIQNFRRDFTEHLLDVATREGR